MIITRTATTTPVPVEQAPVPQVRRQALAWSWTSPSLGLSWDLTGYTSPVIRLQGASGLGLVEPEHWTSVAPGLPGATKIGSQAPPRTIVMPVHVRGDSFEEFAATHGAFMSTLRRDSEVRLRVTRPDGRWREIGCYYQAGAERAFDVDAVIAKSATYPLEMMAPNPFWEGDPVVIHMTPPVSGSPFPGPPFVFGPGLSTTDPTVVNPGDEPARPVWRVDGPFTSFSVGIGDSLVAMDVTKSAGGYVEIDMRRGRGTFRDENGADMRSYLTNVSFADIAPGAVTLSTVISGEAAGTAITLTFTPLYGSYL